MTQSPFLFYVPLKNVSLETVLIELVRDSVFILQILKIINMSPSQGLEHLETNKVLPSQGLEPLVIPYQVNQSGNSQL